MFRLSPALSSKAEARRVPYSLGQFSGLPQQEYLTALLTLSHTPVEEQLYRAMLSEVSLAGQPRGTFSIRSLAGLTGISSSSTIRRALSGLLGKLSIESVRAGGQEREGAVYQVFKPEEVFERRRAAGLALYPKEIAACQQHPGFNRAVERIVGNSNLSRREAQVALSCAEGITNAEIGQRLLVSEQTVKFHLRNIFIKFGVRRRTELIFRLLSQEDRRVLSEELKGAETI
jgi:DNA-binding CsgD family transcriptional regulator